MYVLRVAAALVGSAALLLAHPLRSFAADGTPSDADSGVVADLVEDKHGELVEVETEAVSKESEVVRDYVEEVEDMDDTELLQYILAEVQIISDSLSGPSAATPSEASEASAEAQEDIEASVSYLSDDAALLASVSIPDEDCVWYRGQFDGTAYTLVFPLDCYGSLYVSDSGILYNLSAANITGRLFADDTFDSSDYEYKLFTLTPMLGSSASNVYRYGSLSYLTYYYENDRSSLSSSVTYGNFSVDSVELQPSSSVEYRLYSVTVVIFFLLGVIVLCSWKNLRR